ncbi:hypothetical protein FRC06_003943, partial [Ceratobasidium sp. 370]
MLSMPTEDEHLGFMELGKLLKSDIIWLSAFGTNMIVLNSSEDAFNLLEKRSGIYSDRVCPNMLKEPSLMYWPDFTLFQGYNNKWRTARRMMHTWLNKKAAEEFQPGQQLQARLLLQRLLKLSDHMSSSVELDAELYRTSAATVVYSVYGYDLQSSDDPFVFDIKKATDNGTKAAMFSNFLVNLFPTLAHVPEWFPGASWKQTARKWREQKDHAVDTAYNWTKAQIANGTNAPSMIASWLEDVEQLGLEPHEIDYHIKNVAVTLFIGGTDTTTKTLLIFIMAMLLYPEAQLKAQKEIDAVIGSTRLPVMEDRPKLEYVERLLQEVLRWCPLLPNSFPHACYQDDVYKGYRVPKGTTMIANVWAMSRNPDVYSDPETFNPDRFLDPNVPVIPAFGFGRRLCPGIHFAQATLFIVMSSILAAFNICPVKDEQGNSVLPVMLENTGGLN